MPWIGFLSTGFKTLGIKVEMRSNLKGGCQTTPIRLLFLAGLLLSPSLFLLRKRLFVSPQTNFMCGNFIGRRQSPVPDSVMPDRVTRYVAKTHIATSARIA